MGLILTLPVLPGKAIKAMQKGPLLLLRVENRSEKECPLKLPSIRAAMVRVHSSSHVTIP